MTDPGSVRVTADSIFSRLTAIVLFLTLGLGLAVPGALDFGTAVLVLLAIGWLTAGGHWRSRGLHRLERLLVIAILVFLLAWFAAWILHGFPSAATSTAQRLPKLLAIVPLFLFLRRVDGLEPAWWGGMVLGAFVAGGYALWFTLSGQVGEYGSRVPGPTNPIYFGGFTMAFALMLIPRLADERQSSRARMLTAAAIVLAFVASALSGSRGAWLAIPALMGVYLFTAGSGQPFHWRVGVPLLILTLALAVLLNPWLPMHDRLDETLAELAVVAAGQDGNGGLGLRVQLWEIAGGLISAEPWSGTGPGSFRAALVESVQAGAHGETLLRYDHPHNQYLSAWIAGGVGMLLALLLLLASPILLVLKLSRTYSRRCRYLAWSALAFGVVFAVVALSESLFERNHGLTWFILLTAAGTGLTVGSGYPDRRTD